MDHEDLRKAHSLGNEGHGVYVCHKCGWPFPNPHPSARHRRAHKKICGTIDGYKMVGSEANTQLSVSDGEHSDDDPNTPGPEVLERSINEKGSDLIGEASVKSDDAVFSDAVAEFSDSGSAAGTGEGSQDAQQSAPNVERVANDDLDAIQFHSDGGMTGSTGNQFRGWLSTTDISSKTSSISDGITEGSKLLLGDSNGSENDLHPIKYEMVTDASEDIKKTDATDSMIESCLTSVDQEAEVRGITAINLDRNISSKTSSISDGRTEDIKNADGTDSMIKSCLTSIDQEAEVRGITAANLDRNISSKTSSISDGRTEELHVLLGARNGSEDDVHPIKYEMVTDASEDIKKTDATESMIESCLTSVDQDTEVRGITATTLNRNMIFPNEVAGETVEGASKLEGTDEMTSEYVRNDEVVPSEKEHSDGFDMHIPQIDPPPQVESVAHVNTSVDTAERKVDDTDGIQYFSPGRLIESCNEKEDGNANVHVVSVPDDMHVVEDPVRMLEDFRNHKGKQLDQFTSLDSWEQFDDNDIKKPVFKENLNIFQSSHLSGGTVVSPNTHDLEANLELDVGSSKPMIERVPVEGEANVSQSEIKMSENQSSDELGAPADAVMPQIAKTYMVGFPEGQESYERSIESLQVNFAASDARMDKTTNSVGLDDNEKDGNCDGNGESGDHSRKGPAEETFVANPIATVQSGGDRYESQINPAANLHKDDDDDGDYEKGVNEKCNIIGDAVYNEKAETSKLFGDDKIKEATENFFSRDPANNLESVSCLSELQVNPVVNLHEGGDGAGDCEKDKCDIIGNNGDHEKAEKYVSISDDFSKRSTDKTLAEDPKTSSESIISLSDFQVQSGKNLPDGDGSADHDEGEIEKCVISGNESVEVSLEENILVKSELTPESSSNLNNSKAVVEDGTDGSRMELVETRHLDSSLNSWIVGGKIVSDTQQDVLENEIACNDKIKKKVDAGAAAGSDHDHNVESFQKSLEDHGMQEPGFSALDTESSVQSFIASEDSGSQEFHAVASGFTSQSLPEEGDNNLVNLVRQHPSSSAVDVSVDSNSQTDSLEANWGSVSVLSMQSDAVIDAEAVLRTNSQASLEGTDLKKSKAECERQYSDKSDMFEAPSFMTLVEHRGGDDQKVTGSEILTAVQNPEQPKPASLQSTGWFPSITHVVNESQGRKKNEEIIAKVTNWSTGKQHTPLKSLLGEASLASKAKSPNQNESQAPTLPKDDKAAKVSDPVTTTVNSILNPESPTGQAAKKENANEWNSPARYPSATKSEKKKVKGRSWVQFVCCASVN